MKKLICSFLVGSVILATAGLASAVTITYTDLLSNPDGSLYYADATDGVLVTLTTTNNTFALNNGVYSSDLDITATFSSGIDVQDFSIDVTTASSLFYTITPYVDVYYNTLPMVSPSLSGGTFSVSPTTDYINYVIFGSTHQATYWDNLTFNYVLAATGGGSTTTGGGGTTTGGGGGDNARVPEPATMLLLGAGLVGLAGVKRTFKK